MSQSGRSTMVVSVSTIRGQGPSTSRGATARQSVFQVVPSWRDSPSIVACSRRSWPIAQVTALHVSEPRAGTRPESCHVSYPVTGGSLARIFWASVLS